MLHSGDHHRDESWQGVDDLLSGLDTERREAFVLTQLVGLSYEETADLLECPVGTIRSRVARARMQLIDAGVPAEVISA
jgi:RNA polymerase sigma-70 factor (ECF subfamily)